MKQVTKWFLVVVASLSLAQMSVAGEVIIYSVEEMIECIAEEFEKNILILKCALFW